MLKEQLLAFAIKAISKAHETKEIVKKNIKPELMHGYIQGARDALVLILQERLDKTNFNKKATTKTKARRSSIKPVKEIKSSKADQILELIKKDATRIVKKGDALAGKKSLAHLVWALGHAKRAELNEGISVHDVSSLLYKAAKIELYPINISRVVHSHADLIRQVSQEKRSKTYLLSDNGDKLFKEKFL